MPLYKPTSYSYPDRRGQPCKVEPARPDEPRVYDNTTGDAGKDGYTRLAQADRESGHRPHVGKVTPVWPSERTYEDY